MAEFVTTVTPACEVTRRTQGEPMIFGAAIRAVMYAGGPGRNRYADALCERSVSRFGDGWYYVHHRDEHGQTSGRFYVVSRRRLF